MINDSPRDGGDEQDEADKISRRVRRHDDLVVEAVHEVLDVHLWTLLLWVVVLLLRQHPIILNRESTKNMPNIHLLSLTDAGWVHPSELPNDVFAPPSLVVPLKRRRHLWPQYDAHTFRPKDGTTNDLTLTAQAPYVLQAEVGGFKLQLSYRRRQQSYAYVGQLSHPDFIERLVDLWLPDEALFNQTGLIIVGVPVEAYEPNC